LALVGRFEMLRTQTDPSLCALAQVASRSQTALLSGLGHALTQATGRQPDDLCHRKGTSHLPDHGRGRRRLTKPKSFRSGVLVQNVQTPGPHAMGAICHKQILSLAALRFGTRRVSWGNGIGPLKGTWGNSNAPFGEASGAGQRRFSPTPFSAWDFGAVTFEGRKTRQKKRQHTGFVYCLLWGLSALVSSPGPDGAFHPYAFSRAVVTAAFPPDETLARS